MISNHSPVSPLRPWRAIQHGVALEVGGVDLDRADRALGGQAEADPVVGVADPAAAVLPAVVHLAGGARQDDLGGRGVEAVGGVLVRTAVEDREQVEGAERGEPGGIRDDLAVHAEAGDAAVGVLAEAQVGVAAAAGDLEGVGRVAAYGGRREDLLPLHVVGEELLRARGALDGGGLYGDALRVVAAEVGGVHDQAADDAGGAEADDGPVVVLGGREGVVTVRAAAAAGLPAVHDLALVAEALGVEDGAFADQQVLALGEELVVGGDHARAEAAVGEVDQFGEGEVSGLAVVGVGVAAAVGRGVVGVGGSVSGSWNAVSLASKVMPLTLTPPNLSGPAKVFVRTVQFC